MNAGRHMLNELKGQAELVQSKLVRLFYAIESLEKDGTLADDFTDPEDYLFRCIIGADAELTNASLAVHQQHESLRKTAGLLAPTRVGHGF